MDPSPLGRALPLLDPPGREARLLLPQPPEADLDECRGSLLVRRARAAAVARSAWTPGAGSSSARGSSPARSPRSVRSSASSMVRPVDEPGHVLPFVELHRLANRAGVRRRFAPHQLRHPDALKLVRARCPQSERSGARLEPEANAQALPRTRLRAARKSSGNSSVTRGAFIARHSSSSRPITGSSGSSRAPREPRPAILRGAQPAALTWSGGHQAARRQRARAIGSRRAMPGSAVRSPPRP